VWRKDQNDDQHNGVSLRVYCLLKGVEMSTKRIVMVSALAFLAVGITSFLMGQAAPTVVKQASLNTSQVGRYQIVFNPNMRADTFLLDTETGQTWVQSEVTTDAVGKRTIWVFRERVDTWEAFSDWLKDAKPVKIP
jgi:hypothetical protein